MSDEARSRVDAPADVSELQRADDPALHPRRIVPPYSAAFARCEPCALTLGIPVYVPLARAERHANAHAGAESDAVAAISAALAHYVALTRGEPVG